jgi:TRAP-type mannitol/chloroaromatic compound transport system substrate-binding protein
MERMIEQVELATNGQVDITAYGPGELMPAETMLEATYEGAVDMLLATPTYFRGELPVTDIEYAMPFDFENHLDVDAFWDWGFENFIREVYDRKNLYYIGKTNSSPLEILSSKPVETLDDMTALLCRSFGATADLLNKVGVKTTYIPGGELQMGLKLGTVDMAHFGGIDTEHNLGLTEVAKYLIHPIIYQRDRVGFYMYKPLWNSLPEHIQTVLHMGVDSFQQGFSAYRWQDRKVALKEFAALGGVIVDLPAADEATLKQAATEVWDDIAQKDADCAAAVQMLKAFLAGY